MKSVYKIKKISDKVYFYLILCYLYEFSELHFKFLWEKISKKKNEMIFFSQKPSAIYY